MPHNVLRVLKTPHTEKYYSGHEETADAGLDLFVSQTKEISSPAPDDRFIIHSGVFCEFLVDGEPSAFWLVPRSSISKTPLTLANSTGLIDASYRGELLAKVRADSYYKVNEGDRLFQVAAPNLHPIHVELIDSLSTTDRGEGGFGSTGK